MGKLTNHIFTRRQIEGLLSDGKAIVIYDGNVLSVNSWMRFHPGGDKAVRHMVGRDATDEINVLHSEEARRRMKSFIIGKIEGPWTNFRPPIQGGTFRPYNGEDDEEIEEPTLPSESHSGSSSPSLSPGSGDEHFVLDPSVRRRRAPSLSSSVTSVSDAGLPTDPARFDPEYLTQQAIQHDLAKYPSLDFLTQRRIVEKYRALEDRIRTEGLYECNYWAYGPEIIRYTTLFTLSMLTLWLGWYKTSALLLGAFWHQLVFTAHDAGHMGITHNFQVDTCLGIFIADFLGGLSLGWWKRSHNVHHIVTNDPEHDPDIEHLPFFAISHKFFDGLFSSYYERIMPYDAFAQFLVRYQNYLYYPVLLFGRFNLYRLSLEYLILGLGPRRGSAAWHRYLELSGLMVFWYWFGYGVLYHGLSTNWERFVYVMLSHMMTMPLHVQITLSHFAMSTADLGVHESFPQKMLRTSMDVDCSEWLDFFHGGLQFQAIHHMYPRIPRHNLRQTQKLVIEFCKDVGIPYSIYDFYRGNQEIISRLAEVARQAQILKECQEHLAKAGDYRH